MMDFIYGLYQSDHFVLYMTIALVILIVLFVIVLIFGKKDQKLEETKRLQKIELNAFKEEAKEPLKVEVEPVKEDLQETIPEETKEVKSFFDDTQVLPQVKDLEENTEDVNVTVFEPALNREEDNEAIDNNESNPLFMVENSDLEIKDINQDLDIEKDLTELENIKNEFNKIEIPKTEEIEENKKPYKAGPQVFSSVFVKKEENPSDDSDHLIALQDEDKYEDLVVEKTEEKADEKGLFFTIDDDETMELPSLKNEETVNNNNKPFSFDDINGETYDIK